jgi:antitoxin FitA
MQEVVMPALQVREFPEDLYAQIGYLARREHRSLAQETVVLLKESIAMRLGNKERRKKMLVPEQLPGIDGSGLPNPTDLIREDRQR